MRKENERLQERKRQMAEDAQKIKEFSEHILKLHLNWKWYYLHLNKKNNLLG